MDFWLRAHAFNSDFQDSVCFICDDGVILTFWFYLLLKNSFHIYKENLGLQYGISEERNKFQHRKEKYLSELICKYTSQLQISEDFVEMQSF